MNWHKCMFITNKYTKWYYNIVATAQARISSGYTEKHHIIPKSIGGTNEKENLVILTAKEHFICHLLLTKMTTGTQNRSMWHAAWKMANQKRKYQDRYIVTSKIYEIIKIANAKALSESNTGKPVLSRRGITNSIEHNEKLRQANLGKTRSAESIAKQSATMTGRKRSAEFCEAVSKGLKGRESPTKGMEWTQLIVTCPHCNKEGGTNGMKRYHFDNCKKLNTI